MASREELLTMSTPDWLPDMISVDGDITKIVALLYRIYKRDFSRNKKNFQGCYVWCEQQPSSWSGRTYEKSFLHLITRFDYETEERLFDPRRSERLPWCGAVIENTDRSEIVYWDYKEGNKSTRTYIWLKEFDYVVILQKRSLRKFDVYFLITAFHVDGASKRINLERKFKNRLS